MDQDICVPMLLLIMNTYHMDLLDLSHLEFVDLVIHVKYSSIHHKLKWTTLSKFYDGVYLYGILSSCSNSMDLLSSRLMTAWKGGLVLPDLRLMTP